MARKYDDVRKERFVHHVILGMHPTNAAKAAGFMTNPRSTGKTLMQDEYVRELIEAYRIQLAKRLHVDRVKLTEMTMDAFDVAQVQGDAKSMVSAVRELGDIHGLHSPQEILVTKTSDQAEAVVAEVRSLPEAKLLELAAPLEGEILDAEFVKLEHKADE